MGSRGSNWKREKNSASSLIPSLTPPPIQHHNAAIWVALQIRGESEGYAKWNKVKYTGNQQWRGENQDSNQWYETKGRCKQPTGTEWRNKNSKKMRRALAGVAQWIEHGLQTKGLLVRFPVRAHAWVAGQVPSGGFVRGNHTLMFLYLYFSFPSPL